VIFRFRTQRYRRERLTVEFPEAFGRFLRLTILDGDDPPLTVAKMTVEGRPRYVVFPFETGRRYRLFYGNPSARRPRYEYTKVLQHEDLRSAVAARLGAATANPRFVATREAPEVHPWIARNQWVLYVGLGVAVAVLAGIALRALRRPPAETDAEEARPPSPPGEGEAAPEQQGPEAPP